MYSDEYKYWLAYKKNNTSYFRCARYKKKCPARCVIENGKLRNSTDHNHPPESDKILVDKFRKILTQRSAKEQSDLHTIYWEEASQRHAEAAMLYSFSAAESAMRKARRKQLPQAPNKISQLDDILSQSKLFYIQSGNEKEQFYQTTISMKNSTCAIFLHLKTLQLIQRIDEIHFDVTFESKPQTPPNYYLLTAHSVQLHNSIPVLYVIMTEKDETTYAAIFAYIRENLSNYIKPNVIISNFDVKLQLALSYTFPEANIKGFWFEYCDAVLIYMNMLGLKRETARGHGCSCLRMLLVLPLLPAEYIALGLEAVRKWAKEKKIYSQQIIKLCLYIENNWLRSVGAEKMSIFGLPHIIYSHVKNYNKELKTAIGIINPMIWHMLECLTHLATKTYTKLNKKNKIKIKNNKNSTDIVKQPKKNGQCLHTIINNATQLWIRTPVHLRSPLQFLQLCSHCIDNTIYYEILEDLKNVRTSSEMINVMETTTIIDDNNINNNNNNNQLFYTTTTQQHQQQYYEQPQPQQQYYERQQQQQQPQLQLQQLQQPQELQQMQKMQQIIKMPSKDPPPLVFFPKYKEKRILIYSSSEPPPLVPINSPRSQLVNKFN